MLQANDEAQQLATNCQKRAIESLALVGETWCTGSPRKIEQLQHDNEKKHKIDGLAAVKVLDIETEAPRSPATDYGNCRRIFKPWLPFWRLPRRLWLAAWPIPKRATVQSLDFTQQWQLAIDTKNNTKETQGLSRSLPFAPHPADNSLIFMFLNIFNSFLRMTKGCPRNGLWHTSPAYIGCGRISSKMCPISLQLIWSVDILVPTLAIGILNRSHQEYNSMMETWDLSRSLPFAPHAVYPTDGLIKLTICAWQVPTACCTRQIRWPWAESSKGVFRSLLQLIRMPTAIGIYRACPAVKFLSDGLCISAGALDALMIDDDNCFDCVHHFK